MRFEVTHNVDTRSSLAQTYNTAKRDHSTHLCLILPLPTPAAIIKISINNFFSQISSPIQLNTSASTKGGKKKDEQLDLDEGIILV